MDEMKRRVVLILVFVLILAVFILASLFYFKIITGKSVFVGHVVKFVGNG